MASTQIVDQRLVTGLGKYFFFTHDVSEENVRSIWHWFFINNFGDFEVFKSIFEQATANYGCLVFINQVGKRVFHYQPKI